MAGVVVTSACEGDGESPSERLGIVVEARGPGVVDGVSALSTTIPSVGCRSVLFMRYRRRGNITESVEKQKKQSLRR